MYICDENVLANELDFKKALDLLNFVEDDVERDSRRLRIWARAILRDAWTQLDTDNVLQSIANTVFFKIIDFSLAHGNDLYKRHVPAVYYPALLLFLVKENCIVTFCFLKTHTGEDLADLLPNPEEILQEPQLSELSGNDVFQFLLKAVYEHVNSLMEANR